MAGALDVQLAGDAWDFGKLHKKQTLGDPIREIRPGDIRTANRLMFLTSFIAVILFCAVRFIVCCLIR